MSTTKQVADACDSLAKDANKSQVTCTADDESGFFNVTLSKDSVYSVSDKGNGFYINVDFTDTDPDNPESYAYYKKTIDRVVKDMNRLKALLEMIAKTQNSVQELYDVLMKTFDGHVKLVNGDKEEKKAVKYDN